MRYIIPHAQERANLLHKKMISEADIFSHVSTQVIRDILNDTKYALQLSPSLQAIVLLGYARGFLFVSSKHLTTLVPCHVKH